MLRRGERGRGEGEMGVRSAAWELLEGGLAAQGLDDIAVSLVTPGGPMLNQAQHSFKVAIGRGGLHCCPGLGVADVGVSRGNQQSLNRVVVT